MKKGTPNIVAISILTLLTILLWITVGVYKILTDKNPEPIVEEEVLKPLDPSLDVQTLSNLNSKIYIPEQEANQLISQVEIIPEENEEEVEIVEVESEEPETESQEESL